MATITEKLKELGITLPPAPKKLGNYEPIFITGNTAYLSGHLPFQNDGTLITGKVGADISVEDATAAARQVALNLLATIEAKLGSLDRVKQVVKTVGFVHGVDGFTQQPQVINGCSDLLASVFGEERGVGARSAVGVNGLPANIPVEIELIIEIASA